MDVKQEQNPVTKVPVRKSKFSSKTQKKDLQPIEELSAIIDNKRDSEIHENYYSAQKYNADIEANSVQNSGISIKNDFITSEMINEAQRTKDSDIFKKFEGEFEKERQICSLEYPCETQQGFGPESGFIERKLSILEDEIPSDSYKKQYTFADIYPDQRNPGDLKVSLECDPVTIGSVDIFTSMDVKDLGDSFPGMSNQEFLEISTKKERDRITFQKPSNQDTKSSVKPRVDTGLKIDFQKNLNTLKSKQRFNKDNAKFKY